MSSGTYVCAFRGRRDNYQVPVALAESDRLEHFITDAYAVRPLQKLLPLLPSAAQKKLRFRFDPDIPFGRIGCLWATTLLEHIRHRFGCSPMATFALLDGNFSRAAAERATRTRSDLLLYTPYAWEAFTAKFPHRPRKVLFQFHPHSDFENKTLSEDIAHFPEVQSSYREEVRTHIPENFRMRERDVWKHADLILCASSFTRQTLIAAGANAKICKVVPYGIDVAPAIPRAVASENFRALFVGSGVQRKGLHHLLHAWRRTHLPAGSELLLVCRFLDPGLEELVKETRSVRLLRGCSAEQLAELYASSSLFVMPSLTEGFGQVYLEALSFGCPVLGTAHTCLPDLGSERDGVFLTNPADVDDLAVQLEKLSRMISQNNTALRDAAQTTARRFTWKRFRDELNYALDA